MINSRFNGEWHTDNVLDSRDSREVRDVLILSPYVKTSETDVDYGQSLIVDMQSLHHEHKVQIEEMMQNSESLRHKTFLDYAQFATFNNGDNVMRWLHTSSVIQRVQAANVSVVMHDRNRNVQRMPVVDINRHIRNEAEGSETTYTDASMNASNTRPALIEGGGRKDANTQALADAATPSGIPDSVPMDDVLREAGADLGKEVDLGASDTSDLEYDKAVSAEVVQAPVAPMSDEILQRLDLIEKKIVNTSKTDTVVVRLMKRYDLSEAEVVKALESAGSRKQKKLEKDALKSPQIAK